MSDQDVRRRHDEPDGSSGMEWCSRKASDGQPRVRPAHVTGDCNSPAQADAWPRVSAMRRADAEAGRDA